MSPTDMRVGSKVTVAFSVAKLTLASPTPGRARRALSTRRTQVAQVMPATLRMTFSCSAV